VQLRKSIGPKGQARRQSVGDDSIEAREGASQRCCAIGARRIV